MGIKRPPRASRRVDVLSPRAFKGFLSRASKGFQALPSSPESSQSLPRSSESFQGIPRASTRFHRLQAMGLHELPTSSESFQHLPRASPTFQGLPRASKSFQRLSRPSLRRPRKMLPSYFEGLRFPPQYRHGSHDHCLGDEWLHDSYRRPPLFRESPPERTSLPSVLLARRS